MANDDDHAERIKLLEFQVATLWRALTGVVVTSGLFIGNAVFKLIGG